MSLHSSYTIAGRYVLQTYLVSSVFKTDYFNYPNYYLTTTAMDGLTNPITALAGGTKDVTSAATNTDLPKTLVLAIAIPFMLFNIAGFFDLDLDTIVNFGHFLYGHITDYVKSFRTTILKAYKHCIDKGAIVSGVKTRVPLIVSGFFGLNIIAMLFGEKVADLLALGLSIPCMCCIMLSHFTFRRTSFDLCDALKDMLRNSKTEPDRTVTVQVANVPKTGIVTFVRGLPSDISAADIRRFLETALYTRYQPEIQAQANAASTTQYTEAAISQNEPSTNDLDTIDTSSPGLWNGSHVNDATSNPSTSGLPTPASTPPSTPSSTRPTTVQTIQAPSQANYEHQDASTTQSPIPNFSPSLGDDEAHNTPEARVKLAHQAAFFSVPAQARSTQAPVNEVAVSNGYTGVGTDPLDADGFSRH